LNGTELVDEWRQLQAEATINLCLQWVDNYQDLINSAHTQTGEASHNSRRRPTESRLNPERTMVEQFEQLRVVENDRYPAFFEWSGSYYNLKINSHEICVTDTIHLTLTEETIINSLAIMNVNSYFNYWSAGYANQSTKKLCR